MSHNCFTSFQGHPLPALFSMIWDRLEVSSLFLSASKSSQYGGPAQNDMISTFERSRLDTSGSHGDVTVAHLGLSWDTNRLLPYSAGVFCSGPSSQLQSTLSCAVELTITHVGHQAKFPYQNTIGLKRCCNLLQLQMFSRPTVSLTPCSVHALQNFRSYGQL